MEMRRRRLHSVGARLTSPFTRAPTVREPPGGNFTAKKMRRRRRQVGPSRDECAALRSRIAFLRILALIGPALPADPAPLLYPAPRTFPSQKISEWEMGTESEWDSGWCPEVASFPDWEWFPETAGQARRARVDLAAADPVKVEAAVREQEFRLG